MKKKLIRPSAKEDASDDVEIQAVLTASAVDGDEMDQLIAKIADQEFVTQAFWSPSTTD